LILHRLTSLLDAIGLRHDLHLGIGLCHQVRLVHHDLRRLGHHADIINGMSIVLDLHWLRVEQDTIVLLTELG
jgi:hypothetical protein